jgi:serine O-acetyltransferase
VPGGHAAAVSPVQAAQVAGDTGRKTREGVSPERFVHQGECTMTSIPRAAPVESSLAVTTDLLCDPKSYRKVYHRPLHDEPMPSVEALRELMDKLRAVLFPGYFGNPDITPENMRYYIGANLFEINSLLLEQIRRGYSFFCEQGRGCDCVDCDARAKQLAGEFLRTLPYIRERLAEDAQAAYEGDPSSRNAGETIFCYPSLIALTHYRVAHEMQRLGVDLIPRVLTEMAHAKTGIDIHPGATIGRRFFIDHGTGTVIGETCIIGDGVRLYQSVTLGAKSFPKDATGKLVKGIPRHPVVEDEVVIYSGATVLGRITIGKGSVIGGNVWVTHDVPPGSHLTQQRPVGVQLVDGGGI